MKIYTTPSVSVAFDDDLPQDLRSSIEALALLIHTMYVHRTSPEVSEPQREANKLLAELSLTKIVKTATVYRNLTSTRRG